MIIIERATTNDIDELESLYDKINDYFTEPANSPGWVKGEYPARATAQQGVQEQTLFVAKIDNVIAGTVILNHHAEQAYFQAKWLTEDDYSRILVVHTLAVHPQFMKRGVAGTLMNFARHYAIRQEMQSIRLDTFSENYPAIALYEKLGYRYIDTVDLGLNLPGYVWFKLFELVLPTSDNGTDC